MARVPVEYAPEVAPQGGGESGYLNIPSEPSEFGGLVGQAEQQLGQDAKKSSDVIFDTAVKFQNLKNATDAFNVSSSASRELGDAEVQYRALSGENAVNGLKDFQNKVAQIQAKHEALLQSPMAQQKFRDDYRGLADRSMFNAGIYAGDQAKISFKNSLQSAVAEDQANIVRYTHAGQEPDFTALTNHTLMLAQAQGYDKDSAHALLQKNAGQAMHDAVVSRVAAGDLKGAETMFNQGMTSNVPGTDLPLLDANHQASLSQFIEQKKTMDANTALTQQMRQMAYDDKVRRDAAETSGNAIVSQMLKDPASVDIGKIANDSNLNFEQKNSLNNMLQANLARVQGNDTTKTYGKGFWDAYKSIHASEGDPSLISDPSQLWNRAGPNGDLTLAGVNELTKQIKEARTPDGAAISKTQSAMIAYAKHKLSFEEDNGMFKLRDPNGEDIFNSQFMPQFFKSYDQFVQGGGKPYEFLTRDNIDKLIAPMKRSDVQVMKDRQIADLQVPEGGPAKIAVGLEKNGWRYTNALGDNNPGNWKNWQQLPQAPTQ